MIRIRSIRTKFLLPIFVILIVSFGGGIVALIRSVEGLMANQMETTRQLNLAGIEANAEAKRTDIYGNIDRMGHKALELAAMAASAPGVEAAYALALSGNPADEADAAAQAGRDRLRQLFRPLLTAYQRTTGLDNLQLHFHLPTARSLVRLWRDGWQTERATAVRSIFPTISAASVRPWCRSTNRPMLRFVESRSDGAVLPFAVSRRFRVVLASIWGRWKPCCRLKPC